MSEDNGPAVSPFGGSPNGGRLLLGAICVCAVALLAMIGKQTVSASLAGGAGSAGWWAEPALAPGVALVITIVASAIAFFYAKRERIDWPDFRRTYGRIALIVAVMVGAVALMTVLGFALSLFLFAGVTAFIAGYRWGRLLAIALTTTLALILIFRVGFAIWFPRPALFKWFDLPIWLQGIL